MRLPFYQVDAFTARRFAGNPAAVCVVPEEITLGSELMQKIAAENNLSETAFVQMVDAPGASSSSSFNFRLRWFTPTTEVPLCGHATLAAAAVLFQGLSVTETSVTLPVSNTSNYVCSHRIPYE
mmetsp:Transcript_11374/g.26990  ORF Transcript_11374/g.26990 Transcript_11374/m.26990 type:complete len:124 (+) Transcript_11374:149-520(+)|eukprot:CAMPEP_0177597766 /NCGR_PEP_ID=MMETSP0419_2-20121207/11905_1 /TAXON_ID=582737 /ORGANISM="Tetraselmis sp., Strain GSL018" /LENGTH=123 /DNA_ID=CAMNT_0019089995 /DNA_START=97 /DNA_END=468 /DNA_ORIENTATION=-